MNKSSRLVFFGTEDFSAASLEKLINKGWNFSAVVTKPDAPSGRGRIIREPKVKQIAKKHAIKIYQPTKITDIDHEIRALKPTHGILVSYGKIIPETFIKIFPGGIINVHPSLLPKYRGPSPIEAVILNNEEETGISLMQLTAGMDAGPVYAQTKIKLKNTETKPELYDLLANKGADFLVANIEQIISSNLKPFPQNDSLASYTKLLSKQDGVIDISLPASTIERQIRAYLGYPKSSLGVFGHTVIVTKARVVQSLNSEGFVIECGDKSWLEIEQLISPSGKQITGEQFVRGYKK